MVTTVALVLAQLQFAAMANDSNMWLDDYGVALRQCRVEGKPLLVVLERPEDQLPTSTKQASTYKAAENELLRQYKLCRIDVRTDYGKAVADAFGAKQFPHTVIIDKTARKQVFVHTGELSKDEWNATLASHKNAEYVEAEVNSSSSMGSRRSRGYCPHCR